MVEVMRKVRMVDGWVRRREREKWRMSRRWDHAETGTITRWFVESHITSVQDVRVVGRVKKLVLFLGVTWTSSPKGPTDRPAD